jgi:hypothetical protein
MLRTIDVMLVTEDADGHARAGHGGELDGAAETLVTLGIVVLEADFCVVSVFASRVATVEDLGGERLTELNGFLSS